jgi:hypothetical protein
MPTAGAKSSGSLAASAKATVFSQTVCAIAGIISPRTALALGRPKTVGNHRRFLSEAVNYTVTLMPTNLWVWTLTSSSSSVNRIEQVVIGEVEITGLLAAVLEVPVIEPVERGPKALAVAQNTIAVP